MGNQEDAITWFLAIMTLMVAILVVAAATTKEEASGPRGVFSALGMAVRVFVRNAGPLMVVAIVAGGLEAVLTGWVFEEMQRWWAAGHTGNEDARVALLVAEFPSSLVTLVWQCTVGGFVAAFTLYWWVRHEKKEVGSFYSGMNYALGRMGRVLPAHAKAYLLIWLGNIVLIPGIWFALQYAFVDAIATIDDREQDPLRRSQHLTTKLRGRIFRTWIPFVPWIIAQYLMFRFEFMGRGVGWVALGGVVDTMVDILLTLCFVQYYLDLFRKRPAAPAPAPAPAA